MAVSLFVYNKYQPKLVIKVSAYTRKRPNKEFSHFRAPQNTWH